MAGFKNLFCSKNCIVPGIRSWLKKKRLILLENEEHKLSKSASIREVRGNKVTNYCKNIALALQRSCLSTDRTGGSD